MRLRSFSPDRRVADHDGNVPTAPGWRLWEIWQRREDGLMPNQSNGHRSPGGHYVLATPILAGLHHEYRLESAKGGLSNERVVEINCGSQ